MKISSIIKKTAIILAILVFLAVVALIIFSTIYFNRKTGEAPPVAPSPTRLDEPGAFSVSTVNASMTNKFGAYAITVYFPTDGPGPFPEAAFSPGFGATKEMYTWVGDHLASHGYIVGIFTRPSRFSIDTAQNEVGFVSMLNLLADANGDPNSPLYKRVDPDKRAIMGHSLGGIAVLRAAANMDDLDAAVSLAPAPGLEAGAASAIAAPTQIQAGNLDCTSGDKPARDYYNMLTTRSKQFININGGNHIAFNDEGFMKIGTLLDCDAVINITDHHQRLSRRYFTAWLDYYMKGDESAAPFLFGADAKRDFTARLLADWDFKTQ